MSARGAFFHRLAVALALAGLGVSGPLMAQTTSRSVTQEGGYEITRWQTKSPAPAGRVGWKSTDHERRVDNTDATRGQSYNADMTLGGFVNKCPTFDGKVPGDFEFMLNATQVESTGSQPTDYAKLATARIEAHLNDDATIRELEMQGNFVSVIDGVRGGVGPFRRTFRLGQAGEPDFDAMIKAVVVTGDMAIAAVMWNASMVYKSAESGWRKPNECVEFEFDPPSDTRSLEPNQSTDVRAEIRTTGEQKALVARWGPFDVKAKNGIGSVAPHGSESPSDSPHTIRYTASAQPKRGHGFEIAALTRAGVAEAKWRITEHDDYVLNFESTIVSRDPMQAAQSRAQGSVRLAASTKPYKLKPDGKLYRLYDGTGAISFQTQSLRTDPCDPMIQGAGTSQLVVVDTWIVITPPQAQNGIQVPGKADIVLAYSFSMGGGETETSTAYENYACVPGKVHPNPFWWASYLSGREAEGDVNFLKNWEYVGHDGIVARKTLRGGCGGLCDEEHSVFTLRKVEPQGH